MRELAGYLRENGETSAALDYWVKNPIPMAHNAVATTTANKHSAASKEHHRALSLKYGTEMESTAFIAVSKRVGKQIADTDFATYIALLEVVIIP